MGATGFGGLWALGWAWQTFFSYYFLSNMKIVGATGLGGLWAIE